MSTGIIAVVVVLAGVGVGIMLGAVLGAASDEDDMWGE